MTRVPTLAEAEPGLRVMLGDLPAYSTLGELQANSHAAHLYIQFHEVDIHRLVVEARRRGTDEALRRLGEGRR